MSRDNEILKEKFGISTEGKSLEQVLKEIGSKWDTLDEDDKKELVQQMVKEFSVNEVKDIKRGLRAKTKVIDESFQMSDEDCKLMMDYLKSTGESGKVIGEVYKSIYAKCSDSLCLDLDFRSESEKELEKLTKEFKAKDWI